MDVLFGITEKQQPVVLLPKHKVTIAVNKTTKEGIMFSYVENDIPVSKLVEVHLLDASADTINSIMEAVENIEQLEDEAESYSDIGWKQVDQYLAGALEEGEQRKRIESYMSIENRLLEARNALNVLCHRFFVPKLTELGVIEKKEQRPEGPVEGSCGSC